MSATTPAVSSAAAAPAPVPQWLADLQALSAQIVQLGPFALQLIGTIEGVKNGTLPAPATPASSSSSGGVAVSGTISLETDVGAVATAAGAAFTASGKIADAVKQHEALLNTPAMEAASEAQKWQAFKDLINRAETSGDEATSERLQS